MQSFDNDTLRQLKIDYQKQGYVLIKDFFNQAEMECLTQWTHEITQWPAVSEKWLKYYERLENNKTVLSRVENFVEYHAGFKDLANNNEFLELLHRLMGEPVVFFKEKLNIKAPGAKGYTPHQDAPAFFDIEYDAISIFIAIDFSTVDNGCLYFVRNDEPFQENLLPQNSNNRALSKEICDAYSWVALECNPKDVIIFSAYAPHYSTPNRTSSTRRAVFMTFGKKTKAMHKTEVYYGKKRKIFPQDSEKQAGEDYTEAAKIYSFSSPVIINLEKK